MITQKTEGVLGAGNAVQTFLHYQNEKSKKFAGI